MIKESQTSLMDFLQQIMPDFKGHIIMMRKPRTNNKAATALFSLWKNENNKAGDKSMRRPATLSREDVSLMEREGLVKEHGEKLVITQKGSEIIKTMILGDDKSSYEDSNIDFDTALANTKPGKIAGKKTASKISEGNWYKRLK